MRRAAEQDVWRALHKSQQQQTSKPVAFGKVNFDISVPCTVIGGRNGAGKTRLLKYIEDHLGDNGLLLNLHFLCEQALIVLRSRDDFSEMTQEFEVLGPDKDRQDDVQRIIGREYERIEWYALEVEPSDKTVAERFCWGGEQPLLPYFEVQSHGVRYSSESMGLGEFSVHMLFWILEQYRGVENLTLLLDEPDAYLPPIGASALLVRLLNICLQRGWRLIISTHSSEMIAEALGAEAFMLLRTDVEGGIIAVHSQDDPSSADTLLARPPIRHIIFVEDESAFMLARILIEKLDRRLTKTSAIIWGNGAGYLSALQQHLPRPPSSDLHYVYLFDGDQHEDFKKSTSKQWPALLLPTKDDPDELFRTLRTSVGKLAERLRIPGEELGRFLDSIEGEDPHDWVNDFGHEYGRQQVLRTLSELWVESNEAAVRPFLEELKKALGK
ncbi:ATP-dependent nuclease [Corynebacterium suedekumii]|uniref:ATPase AAA-type core domain-containing protein n=1 Tax=Corynebacterium suedekumii TaxID=3049801 RepID=A0ABY8VPR0_9CORY|nr:hypothetical protein [Corynebacterium suedekumii]WIM71001.1 hypothetical protein QP029_04095 [Corynebacterium suedekumii]